MLRIPAATKIRYALLILSLALIALTIKADRKVVGASAALSATSLAASPISNRNAERAATAGFNAAPAALFATLMVNDLGDAPDASAGNGTCATAGSVCTLRAAIQEANALAGTDTITFSVSGTINLTSALPDLSSNITIDNSNGPAALTVNRSSGGNYRIFNVSSSVTVTLDGLTITNGNGDEGGGIRNAGTLTIQDCTISGNRTVGARPLTGGGAGVFNASTGSLTILRSAIINNIATGQTGGGGAGAGGGGGGLGGGIYNNGGTVVATNATISGNQANGGAGGGAGSLCCVFGGGTGGGNGGASGVAGGFGGGGGGGANGQGGAGGGRFGGGGGGGSNTSGAPGGGPGGFLGGGGGAGNSGQNRNGAGGGGGGAGGAVFQNGGTLSLTNVTLVSNSAAGGGGGTSDGNSQNGGAGGSIAGGIYNETGTLTIKNSIVAANTAASSGDCGSNSTAIVTNGFNLSGTVGGCPSGGTSDQTIAASSIFTTVLGSLDYNGGLTPSYAPLIGSPVIDKGGSGTTEDQRGETRPFDTAGVASAASGNASDIGAVESVSFSNLTVTNTNSGGPGSLARAISVATPGSTITISATGTIKTFGGDLLIDKNLTINGPGAGSLTVSGNDTSRVFFVNTSIFNLSGVTIAHGRAAGGNGASEGGGGSAGVGAGMFVNTGTVTLTNVPFNNNQAVGGNGGMGSYPGGGGGGGIGSNGSGRNGGDGGNFNTVGGLGGTASSVNGANGGDGAGGGGGYFDGEGGDGGFAGGGGGGGFNSLNGPILSGGTGGFGGGGGAGNSANSSSKLGLGGLGGMFGGKGGNAGTGFNGGGGGGGGGLGGALFIRAGSVTLAGSNTFTSNIATRGTGATATSPAQAGTNGQGKGGAIFVSDGAVLTGVVPTFSANSATNAGATVNDNADLYNPAVTATSITSANSTTFTVGTAGSFTVTSTGSPAPTFTVSGTLPNGVTLNNATGVLSGTPAAGTGGIYNLIFTASNGFGSNSTQNFTLTVNQAPAITSANSTTFLFGMSGSFTVTKTGFPAPTLSQTGTLPSGVTFNAATGVLSGTPAPGTAGSYNIIFTATNGVGTAAMQSFTLIIACPTITVTNPGTNSGTAGTFFSRTFTQSGGLGTTTFSTASALPAGITFSTGGVLSGTPTQTGTFPIAVKATDSNGCMGTGATYTLTINCPTITVTNPGTNSGTASAAFSQTFTQTGGFGTTTFSTVSTLPTGITLSSGGVLSGTPTQTGSFPITVKATDSNGCMGTGATYTLTINCQTITVTNPGTNSGTASTAFSQTFTQAGGIGTTTFSTASTLPTGITLSTGGVLSGTPTQTGSFPITVKATDSNSCMGTGATYTLTINCQTITVTNPVTNSGTAGTAFSQTFTQTGGIGTTTFSTVSTLPTGLTLSTGGVLSGTPTQTGSFPITVKATDSNGCMGTGATYTLTINCQTITVISPGTNTGTAGTAFSQTFTQTSGIGTTTFSTASSLPTGLTLSTGGVLSGTPTQTGTFPITVKATDANGCMGTGATYTLTINCQTITVNVPGVNNGGVNMPFSQTFTQTGGIGTTTFSTASTLPTGITLSTGGVLSGTTLQVGSFPITVKATDSNGCMGTSATYTLTITNNSCPSLLTVNDLSDTPDAVPGDNACADASNKCTLRAAIQEANAINVCTPLTINFSVTGTISLATELPNLNHPNLTITGPGANQLTVQRSTTMGTPNFSVFTVNSGKAVNLSGLKVTNGNASFTGGGLANNGGVTTIDACEFSGNASTRDGGALTNQNGTLNVSNSTISNNMAATYGGGLLNISNGATTTATLTNCTISGNTASGGGTAGGIDTTAQTGAATVNLVNCTVTLNTGSGGGSFGGIGSFNAGASASITLKNTIVAGNTGTQAGGNGVITSLGNNISSDGTGNLIATGDKPNTNPLLAVLANYGGPTQTHALLPGSPAINAGTNTGAPATDQRGIARPQQTTTDIGAFESRGVTLAIVSGNNQTTPPTGAFAQPLLVSVTSGFSEPVQNGVVSFTPPVSGASATLAGNPATINASGQASVTATANNQQGSYQVAAAANGANTVNFNLTNSCSVITLSGLPNGQASTFYSQTITASPVGGGYTYAVMAGSLPPGLSLAPSGAITGTPTTAGTFNFMVTATGFSGLCNTSQNYTVVIGCPTITLSPATLPNATLNTSYPATITASPAGGGYTFAVTSGLLPAGLTFNSNGSFSGAPTQSGTFNFRVTATGFGSCSGFHDYMLTVGCPAITVNPATLPGGTVGTGYSQSVSATPAGAYSFSVVSGVLPNGLTLNASTGTITGAPTINGSFNFTITATAGGCSGSRNFTVAIACGSITLPASLPAATLGVAYSASTAASPSGTYTYSLQSGALASGLTLNTSTGAITGTPTGAGNYNFTIKATGAGNCAGTQSYSLTVSCPTIAVSPATLPNGTTGTAYSQTISATPAGGNYTFAVSSGSLPAGLNLNPSTGVITGTPTTNGTYNFSVTATGFGSCASAPKSYSIIIGSGGCPTITLPDIATTGTIGSPYSQSAAASPSGSYTYTLTGTVPTGVTFYNAAALLYGYPAANGTYNFTITATDSSNCTGSKSYTVIIGAGFARAVANDFDGDGKSDLVVWRGKQNQWEIANSGDGKQQVVQLSETFDPINDVMACGDYDGDGKYDLAFYRRSTGQWLIRSSKDGAAMTEQWGISSDVPVSADYDGDGKADLAVWRESEGAWYIKRSSDGQTQTELLGATGMLLRDIPVPADYDGDGKTDIAIFRQGIRQGGHWYIKQSSDGAVIEKELGLIRDVPVVADYDGDGKADIAVWRGSNMSWYVQRTSDRQTEAVIWSITAFGDVPTSGDYDGDGKADIAVWRASEGSWYIRGSRDETVMTKSYSQAGDIPLTGRR